MYTTYQNSFAESRITSPTQICEDIFNSNVFVSALSLRVGFSLLQSGFCGAVGCGLWHGVEQGPGSAQGAPAVLE